MEMDDTPDPRMLSIMRGPVCLIMAEKGGRQLCVVPDAIRDLEQLEKPCVVVSIAGLYRTGKSYLLNRLAGRTNGFSLGSTIQSCTKGIWIWVVDHPLNPNAYLVLLDTEGLGDVEKGDADYDNWIFCLATLLGSTLVYNMFGCIDEGAIAKLNFITEMSKHIRTHSDDHVQDDRHFDWYFPVFVMALRDFTVEKIINGREITSDEYLEHCLTQKQGDSETIKRYNFPRNCIRKYFGKRKCFTFDRPASRKKLLEMERLTDSELSEDFVEEIKEFCNFIFQCAPIKKLENGIQINGRMLSVLVTSYVDSIRQGAVPCIENAVITMATIENTKAVEQGIDMYRNLMVQRVCMPTPDDASLNEVHFICLKESVNFFLQRAVFDSDHTYQEEMNERIELELHSFRQQNESASIAKCTEFLKYLYENIENNMKEGQYAKSGGYMEYQKDMQAIQNQYHATPNLGVKMAATLIEFLQSKVTEGNSIMAADQRVSVEEKKAEEAKKEAQLMQERKVQAEKEAQRTRQHAEERERAIRENMEQLEKQRDKEISELKKHHEDVLGSRMAEQERTLREGFDKQAAELRSQIEELKKRPPPPPPPPPARRSKKRCSIM